jgi:DUF4097 and DUF4098 domain-containing protein YvlB
MYATPSMGRIVRLLAVAVTAVGLAACDVVISSLDVKGRATDQWTRTYQVAATGEIEIANTNGGIDVTGGTGSQVEITAERTARGMTDEDARKLLGQVQLVEDSTPAHLRLEMKVPAGETRHLEVKYHVKAPAGVSVRLQTTNGEISVAQMTGAVTAEVTNGSVRGRELGGAVEASTTNGTVRLDVTAIAAGGIRAETVNGSIDVSMPATAKADVDASCLNGRISIDGMKLDGPEPTRRHLTGRLNGGGPKVSLDTTNGRVQITGR